MGLTQIELDGSFENLATHFESRGRSWLVIFPRVCLFVFFSRLKTSRTLCAARADDGEEKSGSSVGLHSKHTQASSVLIIMHMHLVVVVV